MKKKKNKQNKSHNRKFHTTDFKPNDPYPRVRATQDWQALFTQSVSPRSPGSPPFQSAWSVSDGRWTLWTVHSRNTDQLTDGGITQTTLTTGVRWILCLLITVIRLISVSAVFIVWHRIYLMNSRNTDQLTDGGITQTTLTTGVPWILCLLITVIRLITVSAVFIVWHRIYLSWVS